MTFTTFTYNVVKPSMPRLLSASAGSASSQADNGVPHRERNEHSPMKRKLLAATGVAAMAAAVLTGCSSGGSAEPEASCTNEIKVADAPQVSVWAWYPAFEP